MSKSSVFINGVVVSGGRNIRIHGGRIIVDGQDVTPDTKVITVEVHGDVDRLEAEVCDSIVVHGSARDVATQSGDVTCGDVHGSVQTMSGDVRCGSVLGNVKTMSGDVRKA